MLASCGSCNKAKLIIGSKLSAPSGSPLGDVSLSILDISTQKLFAKLSFPLGSLLLLIAYSYKQAFYSLSGMILLSNISRCSGYTN